MSETTQHEASAPTEAANLRILLLPGFIDIDEGAEESGRGFFSRLWHAFTMKSKPELSQG